VETVGVRDLANRASAVLDGLEQGGQPVIVTRRGHPVAVLSPIDVEEFHDYVLANAPEFVEGRRAAEERFARGEYGQPLEDVMAELEAEDGPGTARA
jgi:prevent-host-death family protein